MLSLFELVAPFPDSSVAAPLQRDVTMTKLNWDKADRYERDPGSVIDVPESRERWTTPEEKKLKGAERVERNRDLRRRSEEHDQKLIVGRQMKEIRRKQDLDIPLSGWDRLMLRHHD